MSNLEDLVKAYLTIRFEREKILHEYEEQDKKLKEDMTLIEQSMLSVCNDNEAVELLERRIHQGNFKEFMSEHQQDGLPPGVNVMREFGIVVRKPASS